MAIDLKNLTIEKAHQAFKSGEFSVRELIDAYLAIIAEKNPRLNAYLEIFSDIDDQVARAEQMFADGTATLLTGIPLAIKDNILIKGHTASAASKILENYKAPYDATAISKLKEQGAIFLGRTNMDEFAMGSSTQTSAYGVTRNPYDEERVPGGSSGGSAAALAADMALAALGTETCGSVRQPASFCGLVGLKPTYGAVSRSGIIAMGNSLDQVSPFTKTIRDAEIMFDALVGHDILDATAVPNDLRTLTANSYQLTAKKIGVPRSFFADGGLAPEVLENFEAKLVELRNAGYELVDLDLPILKYSLAVYYIIMPAEVSTNLARFDGIRYGHSASGRDLLEVYTKSRGEGFGREARRRILLGTYILSHGYYDAYYAKAVQVRKKITEELESAFQSVDLIVTPTTPTPAFKLGEKMDDPVAMYLCDIFSAPANLAGIPSIAIPSGTTPEGLPLSIQFMAPKFCEDRFFMIGKHFTQES